MLLCYDPSYTGCDGNTQIKTEIISKASRLMTFSSDNEIILISVTNIQTSTQHCHISHTSSVFSQVLWVLK